jgi:hypothetical protein
MKGEIMITIKRVLRDCLGLFCLLSLLAVSADAATPQAIG